MNEKFDHLFKVVLIGDSKFENHHTYFGMIKNNHPLFRFRWKKQVFKHNKALITYQNILILNSKQFNYLFISVFLHDLAGKSFLLLAAKPQLGLILCSKHSIFKTKELSFSYG